jgi:hypothetical protein
MLTPEDRNAIDGLFERLAEVERTAPPRDPEAERLIDQKIGQQPAAPYYLAQTVVVQEQALALAQQRIEELEGQVQRRGGGLFGGLFGDGEDERRVPQRRQYRDDRGPWQQQGYGGGGFLAGAAQTALGVTGGVLLGSAIAGMFTAGAANAAEPPADQPQDDSGDAGGEDFGGEDFGGGDFGDFGGGGDF